MGPQEIKVHFRLNFCKIGCLFGLWASIIVQEHTWLFLASIHHLDGCRCPGAKLVPCHEQPPCHRATGSYYLTSLSDYSHETQYVGKRSGRRQPPVGFFTLFVGSSPHRDDALWLHQMVILSSFFASSKSSQYQYSIFSPSAFTSQTHFTNSLWAYKLNTKSRKKHKLFWNEKQWSNQVTILHMPRQLSCRGMCKMVTWLDYWNKNNTYSEENLHKFSITSS